jgi:hypothetical protein
VCSRLFHGGTIQIVAGTEKEYLAVHIEAIRASESPSLRALVDESWKESRENIIDWSHTDAATIKRFLTFLYTGDYEVPHPGPLDNSTMTDSAPEGAASDAAMAEELGEPAVELVEELEPESPASEAPEEAPEEEPPEEPAEEPPEELAAEELAPGPAPEDPEDAFCVQKALIESFETRPLTPISRCLGIEPPVEAYKTAAGVFEGASFPYANHCYLGLLLAHARVYSFARYHLLPSLQKVALQRLTQVLRRMDCSETHAVPEISELIRFVYDHTSTTSTNEEPLRKLVSQFAAINYTSLMKGEFEEQICQVDDFAIDLGRRVRRRLLASGESTRALEQEIDDLETQMHKLKVQAEEQTSEIQRLRQEVEEWRNSGSRKGKRGSIW